MGSLRMVIAAALACLLFAGTATAAQPSPEAGPTEQTGLTRDEAVGLVLATDPRYAELRDFRRLEIERSATFDQGIILGSDYYRVLPTLPTEFSGLGLIEFRYPGNWLIEVTLVRDCSALYDDDGPSSETPPFPDPCDWRHSWFYRVQPDGTVSLLFDEGEATPTPE
jgi:hypothetical protein